MALKHRRTRVAGSERKARLEQREGAGDGRGAPSSRWKGIKSYFTPYTAVVAALGKRGHLFYLIPTTGQPVSNLLFTSFGSSAIQQVQHASLLKFSTIPSPVH